MPLLNKCLILILQKIIMYVVHLKRDEWDTLTFDEYQEGINKLDCKQFKFVKMKGHTLI